MKQLGYVCMLAVLLAYAVDLHASSATVVAIRKAKALTCGINQSEAEYSNAEEHGSRVAFDTDLCQTVAIAILGPRPTVVVKGYPDDETALKALAAGELDLVASVSDDFTHSTMPGIHLSRTVLFDGQGFLVLRRPPFANVAALSGKKICFLAETEAEDNLHSWFARHRLHLNPFPFQEEGEMEAAFVTGNCAALSGDQTRLANTRAAFGSRAKEYRILPQVIAEDPLAMAARSDDPTFTAIVNAAINVLITAEELGVTTKNVSQTSDDDAIARRLLGKSHELGAPLGLEDTWPEHVIQELGNYGEVFERDLGAGSPLQLARGQNAVTATGGLMSAQPFK